LSDGEKSSERRILYPPQINISGRLRLGIFILQMELAEIRRPPACRQAGTVEESGCRHFSFFGVYFIYPVALVVLYPEHVGQACNLADISVIFVFGALI